MSWDASRERLTVDDEMAVVRDAGRQRGRMGCAGSGSDRHRQSTEGADLARAAALQDETFGDVFSDAWDQPLADFLVFKIRYRIGF
jgi:hypothetical protein